MRQSTLREGNAHTGVGHTEGAAAALSPIPSLPAAIVDGRNDGHNKRRTLNKGIRLVMHLNCRPPVAGATFQSRESESKKTADYFLPQHFLQLTAFLNSEPGTNFGTLVSGIWIEAPVAGLRPVRAGRTCF